MTLAAKVVKYGKNSERDSMNKQRFEKYSFKIENEDGVTYDKIRELSKRYRKGYKLLLKSLFKAVIEAKCPLNIALKTFNITAIKNLFKKYELSSLHLNEPLPVRISDALCVEVYQKFKECVNNEDFETMYGSVFQPNLTLPIFRKSHIICNSGVYLHENYVSFPGLPKLRIRNLDVGLSVFFDQFEIARCNKKEWWLFCKKKAFYNSFPSGSPFFIDFSKDENLLINGIDYGKPKINSVLKKCESISKLIHSLRKTEANSTKKLKKTSSDSRRIEKLCEKLGELRKKRETIEYQFYVNTIRKIIEKEKARPLYFAMLNPDLEYTRKLYWGTTINLNKGLHVMKKELLKYDSIPRLYFNHEDLKSRNLNFKKLSLD